MFEILQKRVLNSTTKLFKVYAPYIAKKAKAGQFIMLRVDENGERIPLTIADYEREKGIITIIFQEVGYTTKKLGEKNEGDFILDFVGPLGKASCFENVKNVAVIGGGLGTAIAYPQAKALKEQGSHVDVILGFRNNDLIILKDEMESSSDNLYIMTDDGSNGNKGFVTQKLDELINKNEYDLVVAIGPLRMMQAVCKLTKEHNIKTIVSMNPIMIDGTGMCGGCRLTVDGKIKFACVDGPDFDGHKVDFEEVITRNNMYKKYEEISKDKKNHECNLHKLADGVESYE